MNKNILIKNFQKFSDLVNYLFTNTIDEKKLFSENFSSNDNIVVFDVGANLGTFVDKILKTFRSSKINFHLFEPQSDLCEILIKKYSNNIKINNFGIGKEEGSFTFYKNSINSQSSFSSDQIIGKIISEDHVNVIRLDSYIEENKIQCIDILKIDIEGKELEALESLGKYLTNNFVKIIKIEISFKDKTYFQSVNTFLYNAGYSLLGFSNMKYRDNQLFFVDAFYKCLN